MRDARLTLPRLTFAFTVLAVLIGAAAQTHAAAPHIVLVEAEQFTEYGGWVDDSQFMDQMGSPFLLAHGLGVPVDDAKTTVTFPAAGEYRVWVRTRDWVAPWKAPGAPGRFQLLVDGKALKTTFGTEGAKWHWQDGGKVKIRKSETTIALHDLTGFDGRCDAIVFTTDQTSRPPNVDPQMTTFRRRLLGLLDQPIDGGEFDLVVVGGGIAGTCAAMSAARLDLKVALIQDRPVLGGNNSGEVRVWLNGARNKKPWPRVGDIVAELEHKVRAHYGPKNVESVYEDDKRLALVGGQKNLTLLLRHRANGVEMKDGRITSVIAQHTLTGKRYRFAGRWFADCTGDGSIGFLAGADWDMTEKGHMGRCNLWYVQDTGKPSTFPRCPWALDLADKPFPGRGEKTPERIVNKLGGWYWESGFDHNPFEKSEYIRDWNFRAAYGAWDALKNTDKVLPNHKMGWMAHIAGKRESRRLLGDIVLCKEDLVRGREFPDACVPLGWSMDLHLPDPKYVKGFEGDGFISKATFGKYKSPYWIPYRCFYSRNIPNLFMAGRDISVTHEALGAVRVMRTCGCMGEIVGMAASLCKKHNGDPRSVYTDHLTDLQDLMRVGVGTGDRRGNALAHKPPAWLGKAGVNLALTAKATPSGHYDIAKYHVRNINDGRAVLESNAGRWLSDASSPNWVEFRWKRPQTISAARILSGYATASGVGEPIRSFVLQIPDGDGWQDIPATDVSGNGTFDWHTRFKPLTTHRVRLLVTATQLDISRIWEVEFYNVKD